MSLKVGIVGLPNVGKSTLFNALTKLRAPVAPYPFTTIEPNVGIVLVQDERLAAVAKVVGSRKVTPATIEVVDIAGLVRGAHRGEGLGNEFLAHIRAVDVLLHVVRAFEDPNVARADAVSPEEDVAAIRAELEAKDAELRERREGKKAGDTHGETAIAAKPVLYAFNVSEANLGQSLPGVNQFQPAVVLSAKIESELAELPEDDREEFLQEYGLDHPRTEDVVRSLVAVANLVTFFTANAEEGRAWFLPLGATALDAAAKVHTDFARGFVHAETISANDLVAAESYAAARAAGSVRDEGKAYVVRDGDVFVFKTGM